MTTKDLKKTYQDLEAKAHALQAEKDDALTKLRDRYADRLRKAVDAAAAAQKEWLDAQAADALRDRPEGEAIADSLGLSLE